MHRSTQKHPGTIIKSLGIGECTTIHDGILLKLRRYSQDCLQVEITYLALKIAIDPYHDNMTEG